MGRTSDAKERLLDAAGELMHRRGYTAVGVNDVCQEADVKKGSFYYFFPSKVELALGVIDRQAAETDAALEELRQGAGPPLERLTAYIEGVRRNQTETKDNCGQMLGCPFGNLALEMSTQDPALRDKLTSVFDRLIATFAGVVEEAVELGDLPRQDSRRAGRSLLALLEGYTMIAKMNDDPEVLRGAATAALRLLGGHGPIKN